MAKMTDTEKLNLLIRDDPEISGKMYARMKMHINEATVVDAVPVEDIKAYLQKLLDEWDALGDRKWMPENRWGYNFIMACFDDLERRKDG